MRLSMRLSMRPSVRLSIRLSQLALASLFAAALVASEARAEYYQWTDEHGQLHFTDDYFTVPPRFRSKAQTKDIEEKAGSGPQNPAPSLGVPENQLPTPPARMDEPTGATGSGAGWTDWSGRGPDYWTGRQRDLQLKAADLGKRLTADKDAMEALSSTRAARVGGRRQRGQLDAEVKELQLELSQVQKLLNGGLAEEALRAGVPADFATTLKGTE